MPNKNDPAGIEPCGVLFFRSAMKLRVLHFTYIVFFDAEFFL